MKKIKGHFYKIALGSALLLISPLAQALLYQNATFNLHLPKTIAEITKKEDKAIYFYQYLYGTTPYIENAPQQLRIIVMGKAPEKKENYTEWQTQAIGLMTGSFNDIYNIPMEKQYETLKNDPHPIKIGHQEYIELIAQFNDRDVKFLNCIVNETTYMFTLISNNQDPQVRKTNMDIMTKQLETIQFKDIWS